MWFILRMTFWLGVVLVLLPNGGSHPVPKSQVSASEAFSAAKGAVSDIQHFCERQQEACVVGSRTAITLGQRAQAGAKMLYEFLSEQFGSDKSNPCKPQSPFRSRPQDHRSRHCGRLILCPYGAARSRPTRRATSGQRRGVSNPSTFLPAAERRKTAPK